MKQINTLRCWLVAVSTLLMCLFSLVNASAQSEKSSYPLGQSMNVSFSALAYVVPMPNVSFTYERNFNDWFTIGSTARLGVALTNVVGFSSYNMLFGEAEGFIRYYVARNLFPQKGYLRNNGGLFLEGNASVLTGFELSKEAIKSSQKYGSSLFTTLIMPSANLGYQYTHPSHFYALGKVGFGVGFIPGDSKLLLLPLLDLCVGYAF